IKTIDDIKIEKTYKCKLPTGFMKEDVILQEETTSRNSFETTTRTFSLGDFGDTTIRKAMAKLDFYRFSALKKYFPDLNSSKEFIESLKKINVDITSSREKLENLTPDDKLKVCLNVLLQLEKEILDEYVEYKGTEIFVPIEIKKVVKDKQLKINVGDYGDQEYGVPMSNARHTELQLNLADKDWYIYDENYGTYEEKSFVKFIDGVINELRQKYSEVYLLRNASLFKIYRFSDGRAMEPDFVLFLKKEDPSEIEQYQLFIEPKGEHLIKTDQWKEDFLKEIENKYKIEIKTTLFGENEKYRLIGLPFYNEGRKSNFIEIFKQKLGLT
ncbi:MAG: type III deoxyribonuclease, partial [Candidatus Aenigmarchaeota archaeon]|nr:type III deoxyribonuclease [Candidatus Aenigmarchaeota archaeon]